MCLWSSLTRSQSDRRNRSKEEEFYHLIIFIMACKEIFDLHRLIVEETRIWTTQVTVQDSTLKSKEEEAEKGLKRK